MVTIYRGESLNTRYPGNRNEFLGVGSISVLATGELKLDARTKLEQKGNARSH